MTVLLVAIVVVVLVALVFAAFSVHILKQYERAVKFHLGRVGDDAFGPGLIFIIPLIERIRRVSLRIVTMPIQSQGIITRDNVSVDVSAVAYYKVDDAGQGRSSRSRTSTRRSTGSPRQHCARSSGGHTLDETHLRNREDQQENIREILDVQTEDWGVQVTLVELKDIQLPDTMKRAMARQAEAEREKRAKIKAAEGEALAAGELAPCSRRDDGPPARAPTAQPANPRRDRRRRRTRPSYSPAPLMSTIQELGAFLNRETAAAGPLAAVPPINSNGESATKSSTR